MKLRSQASRERRERIQALRFQISRHRSVVKRNSRVSMPYRANQKLLDVKTAELLDLLAQEVLDG